MDNVFLNLFNISITASWIVLAVIIFRLLFKKAPVWTRGILWAIVGIRLVFPFSIESVFSLVPSNETVSTTIYSARPYIETGFNTVDKRINEYLGSRYFEGITVPADNTANISNIFAVIWIIGMAVMLIYSAISYLKLYRRVSASITLKDNIYYCDDIDSPFILGMVKPKIYLPSSIDRGAVDFVIAHEKAHLKHLDYIWKPIGFALLTVYWFNPIIWVGYILLCRDIELSCDERVIKDMEAADKIAYSNALVSCSVHRRMIMACPLAFGEIGVKDRVKSVLSYKKPTFWIIILAITVCVALSIGFLTNPVIKITQIDDTGDRSKIFDETDEILINLNGNYYFLDEDNDKKAVIEILQKVRLTKNAISQNRNEDRDKTNTIMIDETELCFNGNFTQLWLADSVKPSLTYGVRNPQILRKFFTKEIYKIGLNSGSELKGVNIELAQTDFKCDPAMLKIKWVNTLSDDIIFGEEFYVQRKVEDKWIDCRINDEYAWHSIGYIVKAKGTVEHEYYLYDIDLSETGLYRFLTHCSISGGEYKSYNLWIEFELINKNDSEVLKQFSVSNLAYDNGMFSLVYDRDFYYQNYRQTKEMRLQGKFDKNAEWINLGTLNEISLNEDNFDKRFSNDIWYDGESVQAVKKNNKKAWQLYTTDSANPDIKILYVLLQQKDGNFYLGYGYYDENLSNPNSDASYLRWLVHIEQVGVTVNGTVSIYEKPTKEKTEPTIESSFVLSENRMNKLFALLKKQKWASDALVDRLNFYFDGEIYYNAPIYFGYDDGIVYYDGYFCELSKDDIKYFKEILGVK